MIDIDSQNLEQYEQFEITFPGSIQEHGILIVVEYATLKIIQVSSNVDKFLNVQPLTLLEKPLNYLLYSKEIKKILASLATNNYDFVEIIQTKKSKNNVKFQATIHTVQDSIILELEPLYLADINHLDIFNFLNNAILNITSQNNLEETYQVITQEIRKIIKFDRVLIYRFNVDSSGVVIAEDKREDIEIESYLGLHYPAYDIPTPTRKFFASNWLRIICDVHSQPVEIIPRQHPLKNEELDLTRSILRSVFPCHIEYLKNMGVSASMSISLLNKNQLWGLIACHHYSPKYINYQTRKVGEFLGQFLSAHLFSKQEQQFKSYSIQIQGIQNRLREGLLRNPDLITEIFLKNQNSLINLTKAKGLAVCLDQSISLLGKTPNELQVKGLINNFLEYHKEEIFFTDSLSSIYPTGAEFKDTGCGILSISLFLGNHTYHLIWFRPEQSYEVHWAGNLHDVSLTNVNDIRQFTPRHSFSLWKESVKNKSFPWKLLEIDAAQELRNILLLTALEFSQHSHTVLEEKTKQANAANQAKSQFLAKMSHELRTPLNAILGFSQIMNREVPLSEKQQEYLGIINRSGEHLLSLINDVLEMSRIEAGQITLHQTCFNLYDLIKSVRELLTMKSSSKGLYLTVHQDPELPKYVEGDEGKLRQIIVNLVSNGIKFTEKGSVDLCLSLLSFCNQTRNVQLLIEVKDTGIGIEKENLEKIFDAFKQGNITFKEGTGLGLSISRQFARLMGGDITVNSNLGKGSTFTCTINMTLPTKIESKHSPHSHQVIGIQKSQRTYRILVVEDVKDNRMLIEKMLESVQFDVKSATNGKEAIALWQTWQPDLIWMDMKMPIMDGYAASRHIRKLEANQDHQQNPVPIIALTASAFDEERDAIIEVGCNDFVIKPFQEKVIFEMMAKYLGVEYLYQDSSENFVEDTKLLKADIKELKAQIQKMSLQWISQLRQAGLSAREMRLKKLISQIPNELSVLAHSLSQMLNNLSFEQIVNLTDGIENE